MSVWFEEQEANQLRFGYSIKNVLFEGQSDFQHVAVYETEAYGKMLVIDGFVMTTDQDEFVYHEMLSHIPAGFAKKLKKVLVIGGGDGGTVRELVKYNEVEEIVLCEIDKMVVDASLEHFPKISEAIDHPKVNLIIGDGIKYTAEQENYFDLILVDSTDPIGPGEGLFTKDFYASVKRALVEGGIMAAQTESPWADPANISRIWNNMSAGFKDITPYLATIPTYPRCLWSFTLGRNHDLTLSDFNRERFAEIKGGLKYLNDKMVAASFALPNFVGNQFGDRFTNLPD